MANQKPEMPHTQTSAPVERKPPQDPADQRERMPRESAPDETDAGSGNPLPQFGEDPGV